MVTNWINTPNSIDAKIEEWWKEMWVGLSRIISWTAKAVGNAFSTWVHAIWAWFSKLQEKFTDEKDSQLLESRKVITKAHVSKMKKKWKKALKWAGTALWWSLKTVKWTSKVALHSVRKTIEKDTDEAEPTTSNNNNNNNNRR